MSAASERGRSAELEVAKLIRKKLKIGIVRDPKSGAGQWNKSDLKDWFNELPLHIEVKNQATLKPKEWMRQARQGASYGQAPTVVFEMDGEYLACLSFNDLLNFLVEIKQLTNDLKSFTTVDLVATNDNDGNPTISGLCRNGHILSGLRCLNKGCPYSHGYRPKKAKPTKEVQGAGTIK